MLYPDFDELVQLKSKVTRVKLLPSNQAKSSMSGDYLSSFRGNGMEFDEIREYVVGDDIRKIDWKITAKIKTPHIKLFREERQLDIILCVDMNHTMRFGTRGTFKSVQAAKCAALIGWCANNNGDNIGSYLFGDLKEQSLFLPLKRTKHSIWRMLKELSNTKTYHKNYIPISNAIADVLKIAKSGNIVFIISDFIRLDQNLKQQLGYLRQKCKVILISVNDPADKDISLTGNNIFTSDTGEMLRINTDNKSNQDKYKQRWLDNRQELNQISTNLAINIINIKTNNDVYYDLFRGLR